MADPLPPLPPLPEPPADAPWRDRFDYAATLMRHADQVANTAALTEQARVAAVGSVALNRATDLQAAIYEPSDADRWWDVVAGLLKTGNGAILYGLGSGEVAKLADRALQEFRQRFPAVPPA